MSGKQFPRWLLVLVPLAWAGGCPPVAAQERATLKGHTDWVEAVAFSPDGKTLVSYAGGGKEVYLWDAGTGESKRTWKVGAGLSALALAADGRTVATGSGEGRESSEGKVELWEVASGERIEALGSHGGPATALAFSPDTKTLASASQDRSVKLWDVTGSPRRRPPE
jgi:WD40 repeat protein